MPHILVVCTANICRSPVGEAVIRIRLAEKGLTESTGWTVESAGTWANNPRRPSRYSCDLMAERNLDITQRIAQMVDAPMIAKADLVLCMESGHVEALQVEFPEHRDKIKYFSEIAGSKYSISDPYGKPKDEYVMMVRELDQLLDKGMETIIAWSRNTAEARQEAV